jgi:serine/threonine protein kinase
MSEITTPNEPGLTMRFGFGRDLLSWIQTHPLDEEMVTDIAFHVLNGLKYLHSQHILHHEF